MGGWEKKRDIMRRYDVTSRIYDMRYREEQADKIEAALKNVKIGKDDLVLDLGCGTGILFGYVADAARATVGLDISKKMLQQAKVCAKKSANVHLIWADADNIPIKNSVFNRVFAMTLIQNAPNPHDMLSEIDRVANDDAMIIVTGLKKVFGSGAFEQLLRNAGLKTMAIKDEELKCHVVVCVKATVAPICGNQE
jgi:ubiquinone/menaquinone biosynthesis C-methylase UbiE